VAKNPKGKKKKATVGPQKPLKAKTDTGLATEAPIVSSCYLPVTPDIRSLASALSTAFRKIYRSQDGNSRKAKLIDLSVVADKIDTASNSLQAFAVAQLQTPPFPSEADIGDRLKSKATAINTLLKGGGAWDRARHKSTDSKPETQEEKAKQILDTLTHPLVFGASDGFEKSVLIFLCQYLPTEFETVLADLAETGLKDCPLSQRVVALLKAFRQCFTEFEIVRVEPIGGNSKLKTITRDTHAKLLAFSEQIIGGILTERPHRLEIREAGDSDLAIEIDGRSRPLTPPQKETIVVHAILRKEREISAERFAEVLQLSAKKPSQLFLNRRNSLQGLLPRLKYLPRNGNHELRGLIFDAAPADQRLKKFFEGTLASDE